MKEIVCKTCKGKNLHPLCDIAKAECRCIKDRIDLIEREVQPDQWEDSDKMYLLKRDLRDYLNPSEYKIFLIYAELGNIKKLAQVLDISESKAFTLIRDIKLKLKWK